MKFFSGGEKHLTFLTLFDKEKLVELFKSLNLPCDRKTTVFGEAYGGKCQGMSMTYGKSLKFIVFDVQVGETWLNVPNAENVAKKLGLEFVHYEKITTDLLSLDTHRDRPSIQAIRNGVSEHMEAGDAREADTVCSTGGFKQGEACWFMGRVLLNPRKREGVVLRPLIELVMSNGERLICKHKGDDFKETATPRPIVDPNQLQVLEDANAIANEWVTPMRLEHILQKIENHCMEKMREIITAMTEDVIREGKGEIAFNDTVVKSVGKKTVELYKNYLKSNIAA